MSLKPGYKQTEIGVIPDDWAPVKFGFICHRRRESGVPTAESFVIELEHIESGSGRLVGESSVQTMSSKRVFQEGDVLFGRLRSYLRKYLLAERDGFCSTEIWALVPENERVESGFLFQVVRLDGFITATGISYGTHMPRSDWSTIKEWPLSLPPPKEQKAIAEALSDVDALIDSLEALLTKKRNIKTGVMQELLNGRTRLPGFTADWQEVRLGAFAEIVMGQSPDSQYYNLEGHGLPLIQGNADIKNRKSIARVWSSVASKKANTGDVLLTVRAPVGAVAIASQDVCLGRGVCALSPMAGDIMFLYHSLVTNESKWKVLEQGSTFTAANSKQVSDFLIDVPQNLEEQKAIASVLSDMDDEIEALEKRLAKTRDLKQGMAQELLTGRTRLV